MAQACIEKKIRLNKILSYLRDFAAKEETFSYKKFRAVVVFEMGITNQKFEEYIQVFEDMGVIRRSEDTVFPIKDELFKND